MKAAWTRILFLLLVILSVTGCTEERNQGLPDTDGNSGEYTKESNSPYSVFSYDQMDSEEKGKEFYIERTEYYSDKVIVYWNGAMKSLEDACLEEAWEADGHTILIRAEHPEEITGFSFTDAYGEMRYEFRYLNSAAYAYLKCTMDSEGGIHYEGNLDRYYTAEEKEARAEAERRRQEQQDALYERLAGTWVSEKGGYFTISREDGVNVEYCLDGRKESIRGVIPEDFYCAIENNIHLSYFDGPFTAGLLVLLAEDGKSFEYEGEQFFRLQNEFFRASLASSQLEKKDDGFGNEKEVLTIKFEFQNITDQTYYKNDDEVIQPGGTWNKTIIDNADRWQQYSGKQNWIHFFLCDEEHQRIFAGGLCFAMDENLQMEDMELFVDTE